jgi:dipeptidase
MCDTFVALSNSTKDGSVLFAKNSDRDPNEAHQIVIFSAAKHAKGEMVKCTYVEIPQVEQTYQVILSKPFWIWGAEMGSNEYGVTIGNEAIFSREPAKKEPGLIGMDFLRLALERAKTAEAAMDVIIQLLEQYGQSGNCGYSHPFYYHNSFLICDSVEAWVLETVGKEWAAEKVKGVRSISNGLTIGKKWDKASSGLISHALEKGWCKKEEDFDFALCYSDPLFTFFADAKKRQSCTCAQLLENRGEITEKMMMGILRTHRKNQNGEFSPGRGITGADVCMHAGWGPIRTSQSAGSMVSKISKNGAIHWLTGTAAPCTSLFKPVWLDCGIPDAIKSPGAEFDDSVMFWHHEKLHREILEDYPDRVVPIRLEQEQAEDEFLTIVDNNLYSSLEERKKVSVEIFAKAIEIEDAWYEKVKRIPVRNRNGFLYKQAWTEYNKQAKVVKE